MFLAAQTKYCLTIDENGNFDEHKTFKGLTDSQRQLDRNQYFERLNGEKIHAKLPLIWKQSFDSGIVKPKRAKYCTDCKKDSICIECH